MQSLIGAGREELRQSDLFAPLDLNPFAVSRRIAAAIEAGVIRNLEDRKRGDAPCRGRSLGNALALLPMRGNDHGVEQQQVAENH